MYCGDMMYSPNWNRLVGIFVTWIEDNGFTLDRVKGSHHIFVHPTIENPINAQKKKDGTAKAYQVKQAIKIIDGE